MNEIKEIRSKPLKELTKMELLVLKQDCIRLIINSDNPRTTYQEKKHLLKIDKRLQEIINGESKKTIHATKNR